MEPKPLASVSVQDFQSLQSVEVGLGSFTVLVGPSSSGKSAFLRALRVCARNVFSPANVRAGTKKSVVTLRFSDGPEVAIERGKSLSTYRLGSDSFTKSARSVPPEVESAIGLPLLEGVDATFSFQFDRPFLLSEPGSVVGQVIGSLTNASLLGSAVREANRRRQEVVTLLRLRSDYLTSLRIKWEDYKSLPEEKARVEALEAQLAVVEDLSRRKGELESLVDSWTYVESRIGPDPIPPPDRSAVVRGLEVACGRLSEVSGYLTEIRAAVEGFRRCQAKSTAAESLLEKLDADYSDILRESGTCPVCLQPIMDEYVATSAV